MGKALVIAPVDGKPDWYLVQDDLGVQYPVESAVEGFAYLIGKEYRLFTPGGLYEPRFFRLLPYSTGRRWRSARALIQTHPATAAAMHLYNDKLVTHQPQDSATTIASIQPFGADTTAILSEGGRAIIQQADAEVGFYQAGDSVAVIHDPMPGVNEYCLKKGPPQKAWIAGSASCPPKPHDTGCQFLSENWLGYNGAANFISGGDSEPPYNPTPGTFRYHKVFNLPGTVKLWTCMIASCYLPDAAMYGALCTATANGAFILNAGTAELLPDSTAFAAFAASLPHPVLMPMLFTGQTAVLAPPAVAVAMANRKLKCGSRELHMEVSLVTEDTYGHYTDMDGYGNGLMLPGCMILVFDKAPLDYLGAGAINASLMQDGGGNNIYESVYETNMDQPFKLVYARPNGADFSSIRATVPGLSGAGQFALNRPIPRRTTATGYTRISQTVYRHKYNAPMDDPEIGFGEYGQLLTRVFDGAGNDITPAPPGGSYCGGFFPGFFELPPSTTDTRNLVVDFLAAYPFMANISFNPTLALPRLKKIVFYAQGMIWFSGAGNIGGNPTRLTSGPINLFHQ